MNYETLAFIKIVLANSHSLYKVLRTRFQNSCIFNINSLHELLIMHARCIELTSNLKLIKIITNN